MIIKARISLFSIYKSDLWKTAFVQWKSRIGIEIETIWDYHQTEGGFSTWYPHERRTSIWSMMTLGRKLPFSSWVIVYHANIQQTKGPPERGSWRRASIKHRLLDTFYLLTIPPTTPPSPLSPSPPPPLLLQVVIVCTTNLTLHWFEKPYLS